MNKTLADYKHKYLKEKKGLFYLFILGFAIAYWVMRGMQLGFWS